MSGVIYIAATSPYFILNILKKFKKFRKYPRQKVYDAFYTLRKQGYIDIRKENHQIYISLTEKGKEKAGWMQIDALKIKKPKKWDKKWRIVIFDISQLKKTYREAFRGKLKELGLVPLQKSVWIHPYNCEDEIALLKNFFGLTDKEVRVIVAQKIGNTKRLLKQFKLR
jgi:DNA-binding transcriptional regulator PaaX